jgi:hypothetical protein
MAERKSLTISKEAFAAALALTATLGAAAGVGGQSVLVPVLDTASRPTTMIIAKDGYGLSVDVEVGAGHATRILNWDRNGGAPLLDGQVFDEEGARSVGACAATFALCAEEHVAKMHDVLAQPPAVSDLGGVRDHHPAK